MDTISEKIAAIDLPAIIQSEGIELNRRGAGYQGLCPFHDDNNPSLSLIHRHKWHWKCWAGCGGGDAVDWVMRRNNLDFKAALSHLRLSQEPLSPTQKTAIQKNKKNRYISDTFKQWQWAAIDELRDMIFLAYRFSSRWQTLEDFERGALWLDPVAELQGQLDVLMTGSVADRVGIYKRWEERGQQF